MPEIDDGPTDGPPGRRLPTVTVVLSRAEALVLLASLKEWEAELVSAAPDPGWHTHILDDDGNELTIAVRLS